MKFKELVERVKGVHVIIGFMVLLAGVGSPFVVRLDNRWAKAEATFNSIQQVYQHSLKQEVRLDIKIAEDKLDTARQNKIEFELRYGLDITKYSEAEEQLYIMIIKDWEKTTIAYELAINPPDIVIE